MLLLQETKKKEEEIGEREVGRIWQNDEFRFLVASSEGKSGGLLTIWDTSKFRMQQCIVNTREDLESRITKLEEKINEIEIMGDVGDLDMEVLEELKQAKLEY
ncbi:hypothetical protein V6N13_132844 [Hibiscus sabdariffa]